MKAYRVALGWDPSTFLAIFAVFAVVQIAFPKDDEDE